MKEEKEMAEKYLEELRQKKIPFDVYEVNNQLKIAFIAGLNKANEWHYIKDELPPENVPLNIITFDKDKKRRLWEGEYKGGNGQYWTGYFNHFIDVPYAWKEIVLPKECE